MASKTESFFRKKKSANDNNKKMDGWINLLIVKGIDNGEANGTVIWIKERVADHQL